MGNSATQNVKPPLSISYHALNRPPLRDKARLIAQAGFTHIGLYFSDFDDPSECADILSENALTPLYVHADYANANGLWEKRDNAVNRYCAYVDKLAVLRPYAVVFHPSCGFVKRFDGIEDNAKRLLESAEKHNTVIAFENLYGLNELDYIFSRVDHPLLKVCYDAGHENALGIATYDVIKAFGSKIAVTHLRDNLGRVSHSDSDDMYLLPFDGNIDWQAKMTTLKAAAPDVVLNLEVHKYKSPVMSDEEFLKEAYQRAERLSAIYEGFE